MLFILLQQIEAVKYSQEIIPDDSLEKYFASQLVGWKKERQN